MNAQEQFWRGGFGSEYAKRSPGNVEANIALFSRILPLTEGVRSIIEFGAGVGNNLRALRKLIPNANLGAIEVNELAAAKLRDVADVIGVGSMLDCRPDCAAETPPWDMTMTKGVLIHIAPDDLRRAYEVLWRVSRRYILIAEYYNPVPVEVEYRGHAGRLWKRDFAGEMLDIYSDLRLVEYGFVYHRDAFPQDDITYFLMEKR